MAIRYPGHSPATRWLCYLRGSHLREAVVSVLASHLQTERSGKNEKTPGAGIGKKNMLGLTGYGLDQSR